MNSLLMSEHGTRLPPYSSQRLLYKAPLLNQLKPQARRLTVDYDLFVVRACSLANSYDENMNIELRNASGVIKSPWYPHSFPRELENRCHWKIIAPKRKVVRIEFLSFRVWDIYVEIADRINALYPRSVKFSGKLPSFNFYSTGHELSIMVKGYSGNYGAGFIANYSSIPAGEK